MKRDSLDIYDDMLEDMKHYLRYNGRHFNRKLCDFAISKMESHNPSTGGVVQLVKLEKEEIEYEKPILETIEYGTDEVGSVSDLVQQTLEVSKDEEVVLTEDVEDLEEIVEIEDLVEEVQENKAEEPVIEVENLEDLNDIEFKEELIYTDIEPDQETARLELKKIEEELRKQESISDIENIALTNYEEQQEESAIISLEELLKKSKEMY